jgi:ribosomal protein S18 acetylase RimI-like enzyme
MKHGRDPCQSEGNDEATDTALAQALINLAKHKGYTKVIAKIRSTSLPLFLQHGFELEARIPNFYNSGDAGTFLCYYLDPLRRQLTEEEKQLIDKVVEVALGKPKVSMNIFLSHASTDDRATSNNNCGQKYKDLKFLKEQGLVRESSVTAEIKWSICGLEDVEEIGQVYRNVFESYPFPIDDPKYLSECIASGETIYFALTIPKQKQEVDNCDTRENSNENQKERDIIALSAAEMNLKEGNVEMTDFATLAKYQGEGLATILLALMEIEVRKRGIRTAYSIARANSYSMSITFARMGYSFGGTLKNNTNIGGQIESMNIWWKHLD